VDSDVSVFQSIKTITPLAVRVPTLVSLPIEQDVTNNGTVALYETKTDSFIPYRVDEVYTVNPVALRAFSGNHNDRVLTDDTSDTGITYDVHEESENAVLITLSADAPITSTSLQLELDQYVALPQTISIIGVQNGAERIVLAPVTMTNTRVFFPESSASTWKIRLTYAQPLRINEVRLSQDTAEKSVARNIRFLAQPTDTYVLYYNADRHVRVSTIESGNLTDTRDLLQLPAVTSQANPFYRESDTDNDTVPDLRDNCVQVSNSNQVDTDKNGRGDVCDDYDRDGHIQSRDNCPNIANAQQEDEDGDGIGNTCDGEESRFTEKYVWVPWAGMGLAVIVLIILFALVAMNPKKSNGA
jgi:hypothetical protein